MSVRNTSSATPLRLRVRVVSGARRSEVVGRLGGAWKLRVAAAPERGRANDELVACSRARFVCRRRPFESPGATQRAKVVEVQELSREEAERLLASAGERRA